METRSEVTAVQVYRRGARVTRRITLDAPVDGPLTVPGLPLSLEEGSASMQVVEGEAEVRALTVRLHVRPRDEAPLAPDQQALRDVRRRIEGQLAARDQLHNELSLLGEIDMPRRPDPVEGQAPPPSPMAARVALDAFVHEQSEARHQALVEADNALESLREEQADLRRRIAEAEAGRQARPDELSKAATATLVSTGSGPVVLHLHYLVPGAHWVPQYQVDVGDGGAVASLTLRAAVVQSSGEDWRGVQLTLSTATPQEDCDLPELHSLRIGRAQAPPAARPPRPAPVGAERLFADMDQARQGLRSRRPAAHTLPTVPAAPDRPDGFDMAVPVMVGGFGGMPAAGAAANAVFAELEEEADDMAFDALSVADEAPMPPPAAEPMRSRAAAPAPRRRMAKAKKKKGAPPPGGRRDEARIVPPPSRPHYPGLELPAFTASGRGHLTAVDPVQRARRDLAGGPPLGFDPQQQLRRAHASAVASARLAPPAGTHAVRPDRFDHAYRAEAPVDVPSRERWQVVPVVRAEASCSLRYVAVPREEPAAYRIASITNPLAQPLLPGPVEVYVDGGYVLTSQLPATGSGEAVELGMGVEPALRVARNTRFEERRPDERAVSMTELHHTIAVSLHNTLRRSVPVEVRDRIPQPAPDAEVDVQERSVVPPWEVYDQKERGRKLEGGRRWQVTLQPGEQAELVATYIVSLYAKLEVAGGNRREA